MKSVFLKAWANKYFKNLVLFALVFIPLILIDQLTKNFIFNGDKSGTPSETLSNIKIIATRSQFHTSTTFLDFIGTKMPYWASLLIDYVLITLFSAMLVFSKTKFNAIAISIALSGIIGNTIDASAFHGVRNVFFIPWMDRGTFNWADLVIVVGAILTGLSFIVQIFKKDKPEQVKQEVKSEEPKAE